MELRDALRMLRSEVGLTQTEFAAAVFVSFSTVNRWENKGMRPNVMQSKSILDLAKRRHVSTLCMESLTSCLLASRADDQADKAKLSKASAQLKLEQHDLLTAEQFRATMDNIDMALVGQRFYNHDPASCDIFYRNSFIVKILGYTPTEFEKNVSKDPFFAIAPEHREELLQKLGELLTHKISTSDYLLQLKAIKNDGTTLWLEMKVASLTEYSYGQEVFTTFCDITKRVEAEQKYKEEVLLRNVSMQVMFSNIHCDLTENRISRHYNLSSILGMEYSGQTLDELFTIIADAAPDGADKIGFSETFTRDALLRAYDRGDCYGNCVLYNKNVHRWFRIEYLIVKNPASGNLHALIYIFDIQKQVLSDSILNIFFDRFFDYVGLIDVESETLEPYYYSDEVFKEHDPSKRLYSVSCADRFRLYGYEETAADESVAVSLQTVKAMLENSEFYSTVLHLKDYGGRPLLKKVTYSYLDKSRDIIIMAQSDLDTITDFLKHHKSKYTGSVYQSIDSPVMERRCE